MKTTIEQLQKEKTELIRLLSKMCIFHEKNSSWDKGENGYYESTRYLNSLSISHFYVIEINIDGKIKHEPNIIQTFSNEDPTAEEVIDFALNIGNITKDEVGFITKITFVTDEKYHELLEELGL